jgi:protein involved in polysaccharide export with SLBB domain
MNRYVVVFLLLGISLSAQQFTTSGRDSQSNVSTPTITQAVYPLQVVSDDNDNLQLAISNRQYPVTPGDVYALAFLLAGETVSNNLLVESDYSINMTVFGKLNAYGMTYSQLKPIIEQKIADAYPRSLPSLTMTSVGIFQIPIKGEIPESRYVTAWGLSRLSEVLEGNLGDFSSIRDIRIISSKGESKKYDLLVALNQGVLSQNPTIKPDDTIIINRIHREITIKGEVFKPGVYQLLDNEGIDSIVTFTGGFTPMANASRIKIDRYSGNKPHSFFVNSKDLLEDFQFHNGDIITVPSIIRIQPVVYVEGGINNTQNLQMSTTTVDEDYERVVYPLNNGETLYDILDSMRDNFAPFADLENGYVLRNKTPLAVNMQDLIYRYNSQNDIVLEPFDQVIIPLKKPIVYVTGAANFPGPFSYNPNADYKYYVNQAGGFDTLRNSNGKVIITDASGTRRSELDPIQPGDTVNVISNDFIYNFNHYFPVIVTSLAAIVTMITITDYLQNGYSD